MEIKWHFKIIYKAKILLFVTKLNTEHDNIVFRRKKNHSSIIVKGISVPVICSGEAADKEQLSITVSHLWAFVPGSVSLLIPTMLAHLQWTGAHQLCTELDCLCGLTAAWYIKKHPARHINTKINTNTLHPHPSKKHTICKQSRARFHSFSSTIMNMNMNNPLAQTLAGCAIMCYIQTLKMSTQRQKGKLRNKSDNTVWACNQL